jgi:hypothetical protein
VAAISLFMLAQMPQPKVAGEAGKTDSRPTVMDHVANVQVRLSNGETGGDIEDFKAASDEYRRARSMIELYAPQRMIDLLDKASDETIAASFQSGGGVGGKSKFYAESALALAEFAEKSFKSPANIFVVY